MTESFVPRYFAALAVPGEQANVLARHGVPYSADYARALERANHLVRNPAVAKQVRPGPSDGADEIRRIQRAVPPTG